MMWVNVALALHLLGVVMWVGGMAFALMVLRPALSVLDPAGRLAVHGEVFRRFFALVWVAMPLVLLSGYAMLFGALGGFAHAPPAVHVMHLLGLVMAAIFVVNVLGPWRAMRRAPDAAAAERVRRLLRINLLLGMVTVVVAAWAA